MNIAVIFAGGSGTRMHSKDKPKQFLLVHGKPIIVHTIEHFQRHPLIDGIVVVCIHDWISYMEEMCYRYRLDKVVSIVAGGENGQESIFHGLQEVERIWKEDDTIVLIHDGVRPLITEELITQNIQSVIKNGSAISCTKAKETVILVDDTKHVTAIPERENSRFAKAPQSFYLKDILSLHRKALREGITNMIDSCSMMYYYGRQVAIVECSSDNIKITTPDDFYTFRALYDARENQQLE